MDIYRDIVDKAQYISLYIGWFDTTVDLQALLSWLGIILFGIFLYSILTINRREGV